MSSVMPEDRRPKPPLPLSPGVLSGSAGMTPAASAAAAARNFQQRLTSSVVMITVALALVYAGPLPFALLLVGIALLMSWEWGHLVRGTDADTGFIVHATAVTLAIVFAASQNLPFALGTLAAGAALLAALTFSRRPILSSIGVLYVGLAAVAMVWLRSEDRYGFAVVVFLFLIVWTTDSMAFAVGRSVGGAKLWPTISPNKTWAGFLGGIGSSAVAASLFALLIPGAACLRLAIIGLLLGIVAQAGDLAESALKRAFGVKDASHLIPGHGGVMDRMDGIVAVAMAAALLAVSWNAQLPASALLIGH